jgi:hypothetical protein
MKYAIAIAALCLGTAFSGAVAEAKSMKKSMMPSPTMEQCHGGYQKDYSKSMHWSKSKFKKACKAMMKSHHKAMMKDGKMKKDDMKKDGMMKKGDMKKGDMKKDKM